MRMRKTIFAVVLALFATGAAGKSMEMKRYVNKELGFELSYPASYEIKDLPCAVARWCAVNGRQSLLYVSKGTGQNRGNISVMLDRQPFSLRRLETAYAHTGWVEPHQIQIGNHTFYFYGTGGGGVTYPDCYIYNLNGSILEISFDGPFPPDSKSPTEETRRIEKEVLETFRVFPANSPGGK